MRQSILLNVPLSPPDPILGLTEAFLADPNPYKVNLGQGVYTDEQGRVPLLECVRIAQQQVISHGKPYSYQPIQGLASFGVAVQERLLGVPSAEVEAARSFTIQALGGTGALRIGADFLRFVQPSAQVLISDPSWENHRNIFERAGFEVGVYPYYNAESHSVKFDALLEKFASVPSGTIVVLHASCHNPTGADISVEQWSALASLMAKQGLVPFLDNAYQGLSRGLAEDTASIRALIEECPFVLIATSFSKTLSLYGERVGALTIVADSNDSAKRTLSQIKAIVRGVYSSPPGFGAQLAAIVLSDEKLSASWRVELNDMRGRIIAMRKALVDGIRAHRSDCDFSFIHTQTGMFSFSGLTESQVRSLRERHSVYTLENGRICVSGLNISNIDYVTNAIAEVIVGKKI